MDKKHIKAINLIQNHFWQMSTQIHAILIYWRSEAV